MTPTAAHAELERMFEGDLRASALDPRAEVTADERMKTMRTDHFDLQAEPAGRFPVDSSGTDGNDECARWWVFRGWAVLQEWFGGERALLSCSGCSKGLTVVFQQFGMFCVL